jgi:hypothetical protein
MCARKIAPGVPARFGAEFRLAAESSAIDTFLPA